MLAEYCSKKYSRFIIIMTMITVIMIVVVLSVLVHIIDYTQFKEFGTCFSFLIITDNVKHNDHLKYVTKN